MPPKRQPQSPQSHWAERSPRPVGSPGPSGFGLPNAASTPLRPSPGPGASPGGSSTISSMSSISSIHSSIHSLSPQPNQFQPTPSSSNYPSAFAQRSSSSRTRFLQDGSREEYSKTVERMQLPFREGHATKGVMDQNGARIYQSPSLYHQHHQQALKHHCEFNRRPNQEQIGYSMYCSPPRTPSTPQAQRRPSSADSGVRSFGSQATFEEQNQQQHQPEPNTAKRSCWWGS